MTSSPNQPYSIHKAAGIIIRDRLLLVERSTGKEFFISPGGSIEPGESAKQALSRELKEEFEIDAAEEDLEEFGVFYAEAAGRPGEQMRMDVFTVNRFSGEPTPSSEVEEIAWINSDIPEGMQIGSIFAKEIIPRLVSNGLID